MVGRLRHSASPVVRDATPTPGGTWANYPQTVQGDWRAVRPTFRRSSLATQSLPYAISAQGGGAVPGLYPRALFEGGCID
jgi:hypothetical protein